MWAQPSTAGLLPPSDSDSEEDSEEDEPPPKAKKELQPAVAPSKP